MSERITTAEVRRRLIPGTFFYAEFVGVNRRHCKPGNELTKRRVFKNTAHEMVSEFLTGPTTGVQVYNPWKGVKAQSEGESILLYQDEDTNPYLKITITTEE